MDPLATKLNSLTNLFSGVGAQNHQPGYSGWSVNRTLSWLELEELYAGGSWLHRAAVDLKPDHASQIDLRHFSPEVRKTLVRYDLINLVTNLDRWSLLYGGAALIFISKVEGFRVVEAPRLVPNNVAKPTSYKLNTQLHLGDSLVNLEIPADKVHLMHGLPLPEGLRIANRGYGDSIYAKVHEPIMQFEHAISCLAHVLSRHSVLTYGIDGLADLILSGNVQMVQTLIAESINTLSTHQALVYDSSVAQASFISQNLQNLDRLIQQLFDVVSASLGVPTAVLWGSPKAGSGGLSSGSEGDLSTWDMIVKAHQTSRYLPALRAALKHVLPRADITEEFLDAIGYDFYEPPKVGRPPNPENKNAKDLSTTSDNNTEP